MKKSTYRSNHPQISMQSFRWMQEYTVYAHAVQGRLQFPPDLPTLAHSAYHKLSALLYRLDDLVYGTSHIILGQLVGLVDAFEIGQGGLLCRDHMDGSGHGRSIVVRPYLNVLGLRWSHQEGRHGVRE